MGIAIALAEAMVVEAAGAATGAAVGALVGAAISVCPSGRTGAARLGARANTPPTPSAADAIATTSHVRFDDFGSDAVPSAGVHGDAVSRCGSSAIARRGRSEGVGGRSDRARDAPGARREMRSSVALE